MRRVRWDETPTTLDSIRLSRAFGISPLSSCCGYIRRWRELVLKIVLEQCYPEIFRAR